MTPERLREIERLFHEARERPSAEREEYLRSVCGSNPELFKEVWDRIAWEDRMGSFLREPLGADHVQRDQE